MTTRRLSSSLLILFLASCIISCKKNNDTQSNNNPDKIDTAKLIQGVWRPIPTLLGWYSITLTSDGTFIEDRSPERLEPLEYSYRINKDSLIIYDSTHHIQEAFYLIRKITPDSLVLNLSGG